MTKDQAPEIDPQLLQFEAREASMVAKPRSDFAILLGNDYDSRLPYSVGNIVYNVADGLVYRCIQATEGVAPDYTNATANTYWTWIAGTISGYVTGRGWWEKDADGTLTMRGVSGTVTFPVGPGPASSNITLPDTFVDTEYIGGITAFFPSLHRRMYACSITKVSGSSCDFIWWNDGAAQTGTFEWHLEGRWK